MLNKKWFVLINEKQEGPYTPNDLVNHPYVTPDTLVWTEGFERWIPIRNVPELNVIFEDKPEGKDIQDLLNLKKDGSEKFPNEEEVLALQTDPYQFLFWILIIAMILLYLLYHLTEQN